MQGIGCLRPWAGDVLSHRPIASLHTRLRPLVCQTASQARKSPPGVGLHLLREHRSSHRVVGRGSGVSEAHGDRPRRPSERRRILTRTAAVPGVPSRERAAHGARGLEGRARWVRIQLTPEFEVLPCVAVRASWWWCTVAKNLQEFRIAVGSADGLRRARIFNGHTNRWGKQHNDMVRQIGGVFGPKGFNLNRINRDWRSAKPRPR